jgi:hypothetical protein
MAHALLAVFLSLAASVSVQQNPQASFQAQAVRAPAPPAVDGVVEETE